MPPDTTDIDVLESGWEFADPNDAKIIIYGAIDPDGTSGKVIIQDDNDDNGDSDDCFVNSL